jgi:hypothetical protein
LQVAQQEGSVRHAVVALACLSEAMVESIPDGLERLSQLAMSQQTNAISHLSRQIREGNESSVEVVLMTCALFVCFEMFQNNYEAALSHMSSGIYVFYNWVSKENCSSWHSGKLTVQLGRIFGRLMLQTILFINTKPREWKFVEPAFTPALPSIPSAFSSIEEARDCLDTCMCSLYHRMLTAQFRDLEGFEDLEVDAGPTAQLSASPLNEWLLSFKSFMRKEKQNISLREQKVAILLEIQHITATILASAGPSSQETIFDLFEEAFSRIIALASRLLPTDTSESSPGEDRSPIPAFDMGILPHLYFVTSRCRHPSLRREALHLLRRGPRQEGIWHRDMLANIGERIMSIEEKGHRGAERSAEIPASARLSVINATVDSRKRKVMLHCCRQEAREEAREVIHELVEY